MTMMLLFVVDFGAVFLTLVACSVPGIMLSKLFLGKRLLKFPAHLAVIYYFVIGFLIGIFLLLAFLVFTIGMAKYLK
jgi:hypothetical protein